MGYYTHYNLQVMHFDHETKRVSLVESDDTNIEVISHLRKTFDNAAYAIDKNGDSSEKTKWYDHGKHLKEFSALYPDLLFVLDGNGEDADDLWVKYFLNGKMQVAMAKIVFEDFNYHALQ